MTTEVFDRSNAEQQAAYDMIEKTSNSLFLAGRAGTGKTTFLKRVQEESSKSFVVLAPTGISAINAGGQTIHSFFGFDLGVLTPGYVGAMNENTGRNRTTPEMVTGLEAVKAQVGQFLDFADAHPRPRFLVTKIGCGNAGFSVGQIAPLFERARNMSNVFLPEEFWAVISNMVR